MKNVNNYGGKKGKMRICVEVVFIFRVFYFVVRKVTVSLTAVKQSVRAMFEAFCDICGYLPVFYGIMP